MRFLIARHCVLVSILIASQWVVAADIEGILREREVDRPVVLSEALKAHGFSASMKAVGASETFQLLSHDVDNAASQPDVAAELRQCLGDLTTPSGRWQREYTQMSADEYRVALRGLQRVIVALEKSERYDGYIASAYLRLKCLEVAVARIAGKGNEAADTYKELIVDGIERQERSGRLLKVLSAEFPAIAEKLGGTKVFVGRGDLYAIYRIEDDGVWPDRRAIGVVFMEANLDDAIRRVVSLKEAITLILRGEFERIRLQELVELRDKTTISGKREAVEAEATVWLRSVFGKITIAFTEKEIGPSDVWKSVFYARQRWSDLSGEVKHPVSPVSTQGSEE